MNIIVIKICLIISIILFIYDVFKEIKNTYFLLTDKRQEYKQAVQCVENRSVFTIIHIFIWFCLSTFFSVVLIMLEL
jgi:hypothetical protein